MKAAETGAAAASENALPPPRLPRLYAIDGKGRRHRLEAEGLEIEFGDGRKLALVLTTAGWGELELEADCSAELGVPMLVLQPGACNVLGVRVEVDGAQHEVSSATAGAGPLRTRFPQLELSVQKALDKEGKAHAPKKRELRRWARAALHDLDAEVTIRLVGEEEGRMLNRDFRGKDAATNVLTFVYGDESGDSSPAALLQGDLVLCVPVVLREAAEQGKEAAAHFAHLVVHGLLHLQGYDHENESEAATMEALEKDILASLGFDDPYA